VSNSDLTSILFVLLLLVGLAQLLGYLFVKLRQPRVVGEILAGIMLGPAILSRSRSQPLSSKPPSISKAF
jgi:Kef-type K+ transport system membrane component KefB